MISKRPMAVRSDVCPDLGPGVSFLIALHLSL